MSGPEDDHRPDVEKLRQLTSEARRLGESPQTQTTRLRIMLLKKDLQGLLKDLRQGRTEVGRQKARQLAVSTAAGAYARIRALSKPGNRR